MEIRTLRYFLAVAREGSITRAANFLHLTQPTLSRQMQDIPSAGTSTSVAARPAACAPSPR